jgi:GxxExxY protein
MPGILFKEESYAIIGACMKVHTTLGKGFLEAVYHEALQKELKKNNIPFQSNVKLQIIYDGEKLAKYYIADIICYEKIIIELKSCYQLIGTHYRQLQNYLHATQYTMGILVNFGEDSLTYKRVLNKTALNSLNSQQFV